MLCELRGNHFDQLYKLKNIKTDEISEAIYFKICIGVSDYLCYVFTIKEFMEICYLSNGTQTSHLANKIEKLINCQVDLVRFLKH